MRTFGLSATVVLALAVPAWAQNPLAPDLGGSPNPPGVPGSGYQTGMYAGQPPDRLPPVTTTPNGFMMTPYGPMPPTPDGAPGGGTPPAPDSEPHEFTFDPYSGVDPALRPRSPVVIMESWARADWLFWHLRDAPVPAFIVSGNPALPNAGVPGGGNYNALVGPTRDLGMLNVARVTFGTWYDPDAELGGEVSGFLFARVGTTDLFQDSPGRTLGVPTFAPNGAVGVYNYSVPGQFSGSLGTSTSSQLYSGEAILLHRFYNGGSITVDGMFGYRYMQADESLGLYGRSQATGGVATFDGTKLPPGVLITTTDLFRTRNDFHGAEIGSRLEVRRGMFTVTAFFKEGLGANIETLRVDGETTASGFGLTKTTLGGVRALPSDFGRAVNTEFSSLTEFGTEFGLQVTNHLNVHVGYNLLYWTKVLRPGNTIDAVANPAQVPIDPTYNPSALGPRPIPLFHTSDLLANGLVLGLTLDW